jgi:hypothetical protein
MSDWFGFGFFAWWSELERGTRLTIALALIAASGGAGFVSLDEWVWVSGLGTGCVLLLFALSSE